MRGIKRFFDFYLDASIHVASSVFVLYVATVKIIETSTNWQLSGFLFFGTIVCYNFIKYGVEAEKYVIVSNPYHRIIQIFSFLSFLLAAFFFWSLAAQLWLSIFILTCLSALYALPFLGTNKNLRSLGGLKIYLVALVWTGCTFYLPIQEAVLQFRNDFLILGIQRLLLVLLLLFPFEIRDLPFDAKDLRTLPQRIGIKKTKELGYLLLIGWFGLTFFRDGVTASEWSFRFLLGISLVFALLFAQTQRNKYYTLFWVEAIPIVAFLFVWGWRNLF